MATISARKCEACTIGQFAERILDIRDYWFSFETGTIVEWEVITIFLKSPIWQEVERFPSNLDLHNLSWRNVAPSILDCLL